MRRRKSFTGTLGALVLVLALLLLPVGIVEFEVWRASRDRQLAPAPAPGGDPRRFDPLAGYAVARELAGAGAELDSISIELVRADGTMDLLADLPTRPTATYEFWRPARPPATPLPIGAGGSLTGAWHERVTVTAQRPNSTPALFYGFTAGLHRWSPYSRAPEIVNKGLVRQVAPRGPTGPRRPRLRRSARWRGSGRSPSRAARRPTRWRGCVTAPAATASRSGGRRSASPSMPTAGRRADGAGPR
jgi:hypothetical protein